MQHRRDLVDAEFVINHDGYSVVTHHGKLLYYELDATEMRDPLDPHRGSVYRR